MKTIKFASSEQISERYSVLKSDGKTKQGEYISYFKIPETEFNNFKDQEKRIESYIKSKGSYEKGKKDGPWIENFKGTRGRYSMDKKIGIWSTEKEYGQVVEYYDYDKNLKLPPVINVSKSYPPIARENNIQGVVTISCMTHVDCTVSNIEIERGLSPECDSAALKSIRKFGEFYNIYGVSCNDSLVKTEVKFVLK